MLILMETGRRSVPEKQKEEEEEANRNCLSNKINNGLASNRARSNCKRKLS